MLSAYAACDGDKPPLGQDTKLAADRPQLGQDTARTGHKAGGPTLTDVRRRSQRGKTAGRPNGHVSGNIDGNGRERSEE